jgi:hypothetical protein
MNSIEQAELEEETDKLMSDSAFEDLRRSPEPVPYHLLSRNQRCMIGIGKQPAPTLVGLKPQAFPHSLCKPSNWPIDVGGSMLPFDCLEGHPLRCRTVADLLSFPRSD